MLNLKKNNLVLFLLLFLTLSCSTSTYKVNGQTSYATELVVSPDRVLLECEYQEGYSGDAKTPHGFMMHILDEENTVLNLIIEPVLSKDECLNHLNATLKILNNSKKVYFGGMSTLDSPREKTDRNYTFPGLGIYPGNGRVLRYRAIWADAGQCYDIYHGNKRPCPRDDFPIGKSKLP